MTKIFYFSATGNSLYVAHYLQKNLNAEILSIPAEMYRNNFNAEADKVGFIFPLHYGGLPIIVKEFISRLKFSGPKYHYDGLHYLFWSSYC